MKSHFKHKISETLILKNTIKKITQKTKIRNNKNIDFNKKKFKNLKKINLKNSNKIKIF